MVVLVDAEMRRKVITQLKQATCLLDFKQPDAINSCFKLDCFLLEVVAFTPFPHQIFYLAHFILLNWFYFYLSETYLFNLAFNYTF